MVTSRQTWDLDALLPGGVSGEAFARQVLACRASLDGLLVASTTLPCLAAAGADGRRAWGAVVVGVFDAWEEVQLVSGLATCQRMAHTGDEGARVAAGLTDELQVVVQRVLGRAGRALRGASDALLEELCSADLAGYHAWALQQRDGQALELAPDLQDLLVEADRELILGWSQLYQLVTGRIGLGELLSRAGDPDAEARREAFQACERALGPAIDSCATALTHLVGTRQMRSDRAGVDDLARPLHEERVEREVLDAMWAGADTARSALRRYLRAKARLLGREPLDWWDLAAPVGDRDARALTWEEAQGRILSAFEAADPGLAEAARRLLAEGAVEVEARPHKRAGAVCCPFGARRTSRIFATFTGTLQSAAMVAHELGHGWHADVLYSVPMVRRWITAPFAETASMFAEDAFRSGAGGRALAGLDQQLQGSVAVLLDNRARFEFERACYRLRREGPLSAPVLGEVMASCQRQVFGDALRSWDPLLWAKKGHFFTARTAFNNWSYAFGYLFGLAIRRLDAPTRRELLLRTGWQGARALAHDMLGVDLGDATFWAEAARPVVAAAEEFEQMAGVEVPVDSVSRVSE